MIEQLQATDKIQVQNFGLVEWLKELQEVIQAGYEFDFETNEGYPQQIGHVYTCQMLPVKQKQVEQVPEQELRVYPGGSPDTPDMTTIPVDEVVAKEATIAAKKETEEISAKDSDTPEVQQPAKRGPKPKQ